MVTIKRAISPFLTSASEQFPVVLLTGARQVGKTTLFKSLCEHGRRFVSLDDLDHRELAVRDAKLFFQTFPPPVLIDEIQYAPNLLSQIKIWVDEHRDLSGQFWLTGSQPFRLMQGVSESLAGRVAILPLGGISQSEERGCASAAFSVRMAPASVERFADARQVYARIFRGSFPDLASGRVRDRELYFRSYVQTYLERDIRELKQVGDELRFSEFLRVAAARTGQLVNLSDMARDVGISPTTAKTWLSLLETSGHVLLLRPYSRNVTARVVKTPKLYFLDTGLASYLAGWKNEETLFSGAMAGAMLETYVVAELVKSYWNSAREASLYFYRDNAGTEIDLLLEEDGRFHPLEVKKTASPGLSDIRAFERVAAKGVPLSEGAVICLSQELRPLTANNMIIPVGSL